MQEAQRKYNIKYGSKLQILGTYLYAAFFILVLLFSSIFSQPPFKENFGKDFEVVFKRCLNDMI